MHIKYYLMCHLFIIKHDCITVLICVCLPLDRHLPDLPEANLYSLTYRCFDVHFVHGSTSLCLLLSASVNIVQHTALAHDEQHTSQSIARLPHSSIQIE